MARKVIFSIAILMAAGLGTYSPAHGEDRVSRKATESQTLLAQAAAPAKAPDKQNAGPQPTLTVVLRSAQELLEDLEFILKLAQAPGQFKTLTENMDVFLEGVDRTKPIAVRSFLKVNRLDHVLSLPIDSPKKLKDFLANINALGVQSKVLRPNVYRLSKTYEGYLAFDGKYAHLAEQEADATAVKGGPPSELLKDYDLIAVLDNRGQAVDARRKGFADVSKEMHKAVDQSKKKDKENEIDLQIRKTAAHQQIEELERFFVESSQLSIGWTTSSKTKQVQIDIALIPVPETSLAASADLLGKTPDEFAGIGEKGSVASISLNFPIDDLRKPHMLEMVKLSRPRAKQIIDANEKLSAAQKATDKDLSDLGFDISDGVANAGIANGFLRMYPNAKGYSLLGAGRLSDTGSIDKILKKLAERDGSDKVKLDVAKSGEVSIHSVAIPPKLSEDFPELFAKDAVAHIGTSKTTFWYAVGENSLELLKNAIVEKPTPAADDKGAVVVDLHGRLLPWAEMLVTRQVRTKDKSLDLELLKRAVEIFKEGKDTGSLIISQAGKEVRVHMQVEEGVLTFAGKVIAKFVTESLEN